MNVSLTPELDKYVHGKVASGRYSSASEVVREALRLMQDREPQLDPEYVQRKIDAGLKALAEGDYTEGTAEELLANFLKEAHQRHGFE